MKYSTFLNKALNSFEGFRGAKMPTNPTTEQEYLALRNAVDGGSIWQDENNQPTWEQVKTKIEALVSKQYEKNSTYRTCIWFMGLS